MNPLQYAEQICYSSKEVLQFSYTMAKKYANKKGVFAETGVAAGAQIIAMASGAPKKTIYAFDSFEGIALPSNKDDQYPGIRFLSKIEQKALPDPGKQVLESSGATVVSLDDFNNHIKLSGVNFENIIPVQGWFEETVPIRSKTIEPISILRLDGDLYNSTYVCLKYLYPKVTKDGICIIDDWALPGCREAVFNYFQSIGKPLFDNYEVQFIKDENSTVAFWQNE